MKAIIVEDEELTAERLLSLVKKHTEIEVLETLHSVKSTVKWLNANETPDIIFLDIQLGDGSGFDVLDQVETFPHVIFTTAFDQYAIEAFKYNSIDYLLKPVKKDDLQNAITKLGKMSVQESPSSSPNILQELRYQLTKKFKKKFLVKIGLKYHSYHVDDIAYFYSEEGETYLKDQNGQTSIVDHTLDSIEKMVDPDIFFRINRHMIIKSAQITSIDSYFNNRLSLELEPRFHETIVVSRDRVKAFKQWMDECCLV